MDARTEAFNIATITLEELLKSKEVDPISSTFGTYIKVCGKLSLPRTVVEPAISKAFDQCRDLGLVNDFILTQVRYSASPAQYRNLLGDVTKGKKINERLTINEIPYAWRKNVGERLPNSGKKSDWWKHE